MPTIEYKCRNCDHLFKALVFRGDKETEPPCPKCKSPFAKSLPRSEDLSIGLVGFQAIFIETESGPTCPNHKM